MKYIRTIDGVFESSHPNKVVIYKEIIPKHNGTFQIVDYEGEIQAGAIIAEADTIEELCDEFVLVDETLPPHLDRDLKEITRYKTYIAGSRGNVYGAVWTSKGLIYVAKLNNKGELELI